MGNVDTMIKLLDTLVTYLTTNAEASGSVFRRGVGLQDMHAFLQIVFSSSGEDLRQRMNRCYKVYIEPEPQKQTRGSRTNDNGWIQPKNVQKTKSTAKIVSFWCFSPGFGLVQIMNAFFISKKISRIEPIYFSLLQNATFTWPKCTKHNFDEWNTGKFLKNIHLF